MDHLNTGLSPAVRKGMKIYICRLCGRRSMAPAGMGYLPVVCEYHEADGSIDEAYVQEARREGYWNAEPFVIGIDG